MRSGPRHARVENARPAPALRSADPGRRRAPGVGARCAAALVLMGLLSSACAGSLAGSSDTGSRNRLVESDQRLQLKPAMDRVGDIIGQEGSVRFLEFRDGVPEPLPGV